jgi:hypothetical protein
MRGASTVGKSTEFVALLPVLNQDLFVANGTDQDKTGVEINLVLSKLGEFGVASKVIIMIADHHGNLAAGPGGVE